MNLKKNLFKLCVLAAMGWGLVSSCATSRNSTQKKEALIAKLGDYPVYVSEFKYVYEKSMNNKDSLYERKSVENYLDLFINFKLKIAEAKSIGLDSNENFQKELESYKTVLAKPYLVDQDVVDRLVKEAYDRMQEEINASHILIRVSPQDDPKDTLLAYQKIQEIRKKAMNGEDFAKLALEYSQDASVATNQGNLGYFSVLQMVYPFETAAYNTPKGEVSPIVRTQFGYHILKVHERRTNQGKVTIAHIMLQLPKEASQEIVATTETKIQEIYHKIQQGEDWDKLCKQYSEDATSKNKAGVLPEFKVGEVLPSLEKVAFSLQQPNDMSKPFKTPFGWHIVKLIQKKPVPPFEEIKKSLTEDVTKDDRYQVSKEALVKRIKEEYSFKESTSTLTEALNKADKRLLKGAWSYTSTEEIVKKPLFSFKSKDFKKGYFVQDFFDYVYEKQVATKTIQDEKYYMKTYYDQFIKEVAIDIARKNLTTKYPEYAMLINEYHEGMMLFDMMKEKVWDKAIRDTTACKNYFDTHRNRYKWGKRATATVYKVANENVLNELKPYLTKNLYPVKSIQISNLSFDKDNYSLNEESLKTLDQLITVLKKDPKLTVEVAGHADPAEAKELAQKRINPTVKYLTFKKIDIDRIIIKNYGFTRPISRNDRGKNRRIEFTVYTSNKKELEKIINEENPLNLSVNEGIFQKGDNEYMDQIEWKPGTTTLRQNGHIIYIDINDIKEPRLKQYDEARGFVITDYQKVLEEEWLKELKKKYPVQIKQEQVEKLIKK